MSTQASLRDTLPGFSLSASDGDDPLLPVRLRGPFPGRPLVAHGPSLYVARANRIFRSDDLGDTWRLDAVVPLDPVRSLATRSRLATRLFRLEVVSLTVLADGARLAVTRDGIYRAEPDAWRMRASFVFEEGWALGLGVDGQGRVLFGEYRANRERGPIRLFVSDDGGRTFDQCFEFAPGTVRHVHTVVWDPHLARCLVLTGDYGDECGIALLGSKLDRIDWLVRGGQRFRAASVLVEEDALVYGTDSQTELNEILRLDKSTGEVRSLQPLEGSSLFAARFGTIRAVSTCVEPSDVNRSTEASLYLSNDGERWVRAFTARKDPWHAYFQFGTLILPQGSAGPGWGAFGGQALRGVDGDTWVMEFTESAR